jgi:hypothetical protein
MLMAKIRTTPQSVSEPVELCFNDMCSPKRLEYDEYFGGVATQTTIKMTAARDLEALAIMFADSRQEPIALNFNISEVLRRLCTAE